MNDLKEIGGFIVSADPFVQHDTSLSGNGTVNSPLGVVPGYNETVLWEGTSDIGAAKLSNYTLSGNISDFERIKIFYSRGQSFLGDGCQEIFPSNLSGNSWKCVYDLLTISTDTKMYTYFVSYSASGNSYKEISGGYWQQNGNALITNSTASWIHPYKIVGINRKQ